MHPNENANGILPTRHEWFFFIDFSVLYLNKIEKINPEIQVEA